MHMLVLRDSLEAVYASSLAKFARDFEADQRPNDWLECCMLPRGHHRVLFLAE